MNNKSKKELKSKLNRTEVKYYGNYQTIILATKGVPGDGVHSRGVKGG